MPTAQWQNIMLLAKSTTVQTDIIIYLAFKNAGR
jgi:hypothetical protein